MSTLTYPLRRESRRSGRATRLTTAAHRTRFSLWLPLVFAVGLLPPLAAKPERAPPSADSERTAETAPRSFSLLPKGLQANPQLDFTVITEMTDAGRQRAVVSTERPSYYILQSIGAQTKGEKVREEPMAEADLERVLEQALAKRGFLRATPEHPADLVVVYFWGSHNTYDPELSAVPEDIYVRSILDRAALVGGTKFAAELAQAYRQTELLAASSPGVIGAPASAELQGAPVGVALGMAQLNAQMNPLRLFARRSRKHQRLLDQASMDCYFVVASAYDHASLSQNERLLLWRTRLTVGARGVSQQQSLPALIASGAPYFGVDMAEPELLKVRPVRKGEVEVGTPTVIPD